MTYDAVIVGGGPSGATAGALLARDGWRVAIVEKARFPRRKVCGEYISATTWPVLADLGVEAALAARCAPPVTRVGFFAGDTVVQAPMPSPRAASPWGRAVGREILDATLLEAARANGAEIFHDRAVKGVHRKDRGGFEVDVEGPGGEAARVSGRIVIDAHGSWERDPFSGPRVHRADDLLGFKARFRGASLEAGLMPLVLFPGAYGGLVHTDGGEVSFSCCIRRDELAASRARHGGAAGEALLAHAMATCRGVRDALGNASRSGPWLSAGPIRPGVRRVARAGIFRVGNAAGEAHPLVAEGISMAIQSGFLLARALGRHGIAEAEDAYAREWRAMFASRVHASRLFAALTLPSAPRRASAAALRHVPSILTWGARWSGKARALHALAA